MNELELLEQRRKKCPIYVYSGIGTLILSIILMLVFAFYLSNFMFIPGALLIIGVTLIAIGNVLFNDIKKEFKELCMQKIITNILPNATYSEHRGISLNDIYSYGLLPEADREYTEDLIEGEIKGVRFRTCDLRLEERRVHRDQNGNTHVTYVPYFIGRFFEFDFNKSFKGDIILSETSLMKPLGMKKVNLESEEFNETFKTYAHDEYSAFYVLTPQVMTALLDLEKAYPGAIKIAINSNKLAVALNNNRDTFTITMRQPINSTILEVFKNDIDAINCVIDELSLDSKIFKEE